MIYKHYASTDFTLNKCNEFEGDSIVFSSNILFVYVPVTGLNNKNKNLFL
jgi:hypothetical protein